MNKNKYILSGLLMKIFVVMAVFFVIHSCTDKFNEYNTDKTKLMAVGPKELAGLFNRSISEGCSWLTTDNYSRMSSTAANHFCGYIACGIYAYEENTMRTGWHNSGFKSMYTSSYPPLQSILEVSKSSNAAAYNVALIWKAHIFHQLTDIWGPIPYKDAGSGKETAAYESQKDVYYEIFEDLTNAVTALKAEVQKSPSLNVFGVGDLIYNGDVSKWIKFGNTLRLRLAVRISNIDPEKAKLEAEAAVVGPMMETNADDAYMDVKGGSNGGNGMPRMESFYQDVMTTSMESVLKGYNDPRMDEFFSPVADDPTFATFPIEIKSNVGGYHGITSGFEPGYMTYFKAHSKYGARFKNGNQLVTPVNILNSAETYFLKAEGAWRGWNMGGTAQSFYEKGIEISIKQWKGASFSPTTISNYVNGTTLPIAPGNYPINDPPMTDIPVKFSSDKTKQFEQIITQKWLALFPISIEAWADRRRTRLPKIYAKKYSVNPNVNPAIGQIVTRLPFVDDEKAAQPEEIKKAIILLGGPDLESTPLWWDVNKNGN